VAVAEELHLARAAERLGIEQSPLSRAMRCLERSMDVALFDRSVRQTRLTGAGQVLLGEARRVLATVDHAVQATKGAAQGYQSFLRIAICSSLAQSRIVSLLARSREEEPELGIRVFELPFSQQLNGLHNNLLDIGFALSDAVNDGLVADPAWSDPLSVILPARHPLLAHPQVKLEDALKFPLVSCHPDASSGCQDPLQAVLDAASVRPKVVDHVASLGVMLTLVAAGYGIGFAVGSQVQTWLRTDIAMRPLAGARPTLAAYLLRRQGEPSGPIKRCIQRAREIFQSTDNEPVL